MELTPIRVRGARRKRDASSALTFPVKSRRISSRAAPVAFQMPYVRDTIKDNATSRLEQLPSEIVQAIFIFCNNISLPMSSPYIARQLSQDRIYYECALDIIRCDASGDCSDCPGPNIQTQRSIRQLLQRRWMTWIMFKRVVTQAHHIASNQSSATAIPNFDHPNVQGPIRYLHFRPSVELPEKVLRGPWSDDKSHFLYYLCWLGMTIAWDTSTLGEVAVLGLKQAVAGQHRLATATLLCPIVGVPPSLGLLRAAVIEYGCDKTIVFHLLGAAIRIQIESRGRSASEACSTDVNFRDPSLWNWAGRAGRSMAERAQWLKDALRSAADISLASSHYDEHVHEAFVCACGRELEGVEQIQLPFPS